MLATLNDLTVPQQRMVERLAAGQLNHEDTKYHERLSLKVLQHRGVVTYITTTEGWVWQLKPAETETQEAAAAVDAPLESAPVITAQPVQSPPPLTRWQAVDCLKAFPKKGEAGVWLTGRYMGVYPGDKRYAAVRINGMNEAARVGEIRPVGGAQHVASVVVAPLVYDQPALPTNDDQPEPTLEDLASAEEAYEAYVDEALSGYDNRVGEAERESIFGNGYTGDGFTEEYDTDRDPDWNIPIDDPIFTEATPSVFDQLAADEPPADPEADTEPMPAASAHVTDIGQMVTTADPFSGMADFELPLHITPVGKREPVRLESLNLAPSIFKRVPHGKWMSVAHLYSTRNEWHGKVWRVGEWTRSKSLVLAVDGTLMLVDGVLAYEVRASVATLEQLFTAWAGLGWRGRFEQRTAGQGA
jgi:hypothetical protein